MKNSKVNIQGKSRKILISNCVRLDVMAFLRAGALKNGTNGTVNFENDTIKECSFITVGGRLIIEHPINMSNASTDIIPTEYLECRFGGSRPYFLCPNDHCGKRYTYLYSYGGRYQCRKCLNLAYPSQNETASARGYRKARKSRKALGGSASLFDPMPPKPKGMHIKTYDRLVDQIHLTTDLAYNAAVKKFGYDENCKV